MSSILHGYVHAVGMFLPKGSPREDILTEISDHLVSTMEELEGRLGRPLTEPEQERVMNEYGSPMIVAGRYGTPSRSLTIGRTLIGPEIFPLYLRILCLNWGILIAVHAVLAFVIQKPAGLRSFLTAAVMQFVGLTATFSIVDRLQRRSKQRWYFPPVYLTPVPRWQSASGIVAWTVFVVWWAAVPLAPALLLGGAASDFALAPGWYALYWPVLVLILAGIAQRAINLARPDWNWLPASWRLATSLAGFGVLYFAVSRYPYLAIADPAGADLRMAQMATGLNDLMRWVLIGISPFYLLFNVGLNGWFCWQHVAYALRQRRAGAER
jgi:hypothetical protein